MGYATDEAEDLNEQQGQDLRQLIKDISNRPNRQRPGEGAEPEDVQVEVGACPVAGEEGLQPGGAGGAAGGMPNGVQPSSPMGTGDHVSGSTVVGGGGAGLVQGMMSVSGGMASSGQGASEGVGSGRLHVTTNGNVLSPVAAGGGTGSPAGHMATAVVHMPLGGMTAAGAAAVAVGQAQLAGQGGTPRLGAMQPAVLTLSIMGRRQHQQQQQQPVHAQCESPMAAAAALEGAQQGAQGGSPNVAVTLAAAGPGGTWAPGTPAERRGALEAPVATPTGIAALAGASPGAGPGPATRHATTFAAVDVAQRVMRSKDSDSEGRDAAAQRAQVRKRRGRSAKRGVVDAFRDAACLFHANQHSAEALPVGQPSRGGQIPDQRGWPTTGCRRERRYACHSCV